MKCDKCGVESKQFVVVKINYKGGKEVVIYLCTEHANELAATITEWLKE